VAAGHLRNGSMRRRSAVVRLRYEPGERSLPGRLDRAKPGRRGKNGGVNVQRGDARYVAETRDTVMLGIQVPMNLPRTAIMRRHGLLHTRACMQEINMVQVGKRNSEMQREDKNNKQACVQLSHKANVLRGVKKSNESVSLQDFAFCMISL